MLLLALIIGVVLIVAAIRNSQGDLFSALATDVPAYFVWAAAIVAVGALGYVPGLKPVSRGLLALIILVIFLHNYQSILSGFQGVISNTETSPSSAGSGSAATGGANGLSLNASSLTSTSSSFAPSSDAVTEDAGSAITATAG